MDTTGVVLRLNQVRERIWQAESIAGRPKNSVQLLAVSKTHTPAKIRVAWQAGQLAFGENYVQEAIDKQALVQDLDLEWHFIGQIQSNKTQIIAERFAWVHSLCKPQHARRLNARRPVSLPPLKVCLQVNVSAEVSKGGLCPAEVLPVLETCMELPRLQVCGLMAIPKPVSDPILQRQVFRQMRELRDSLAKVDLPLTTLSMGMSDDLEAAISEGATIVRIGTAIFGTRNYDKK
ncbi:YggS family pyridoxal phosphate enzyme [Achromatium sp. WMS2]|nr:YggS family pyridoxal phosphate enzyme [Achromatium sp. WMS2]